MEAGEDSNGALESLTPIAIANAFQRMDIVKYLVLECDRSLDDIANEPVDSTCTVQAQPKKPWCTWDVAPVWGLNLDLYAGERTIEDIRDRRYKAGRNTYPSE